MKRKIIRFSFSKHLIKLQYILSKIVLYLVSLANNQIDVDGLPSFPSLWYIFLKNGKHARTRRERVKIMLFQTFVDGPFKQYAAMSYATVSMKGQAMNHCSRSSSSSNVFLFIHICFVLKLHQKVHKPSLNSTVFWVECASSLKLKDFIPLVVR